MGIYPPSSSSLLTPQRYAVRAGGDTSLFSSARSWIAKKSTEVSARESLIKLIRETLNCRAHGVVCTYNRRVQKYVSFPPTKTTLKAIDDNFYAVF